MSRTSFLRDLHAQFAVPRTVAVGLTQRTTGQEVDAVERLVLGDENEVYRIGLIGGEVVYLRICRPGMPAGKAAWEAWAMERARTGNVPVPEVLTVEDVEDGENVREAMLLAATPGRQLADLLPALTPEQRRAIMNDLGRVLGRLHEVPMPGIGRPDQAGTWTDPERLSHREYVTNVATDCQHLTAVGLTSKEIDLLLAVLDRSPDVSAPTTPVLCHRDISPQHVFVDADLQVCGLIDWGMWSAGASVSDLASLSVRLGPGDLAGVIDGHPAGTLDDPGFCRTLALAAIPQLVGHLAWHIGTGQTDTAKALAPTLRKAVAEAATTS